MTRWRAAAGGPGPPAGDASWGHDLSRPPAVPGPGQGGGAAPAIAGHPAAAGPVRRLAGGRAADGCPGRRLAGGYAAGPAAVRLAHSARASGGRRRSSRPAARRVPHLRGGGPRRGPASGRGCLDRGALLDRPRRCPLPPDAVPRVCRRRCRRGPRPGRPRLADQSPRRRGPCSPRPVRDPARPARRGRQRRDPRRSGPLGSRGELRDRARPCRLHLASACPASRYGIGAPSTCPTKPSWPLALDPDRPLPRGRITYPPAFGI